MFIDTLILNGQYLLELLVAQHSNNPIIIECFDLWMSVSLAVEVLQTETFYDYWIV